MSSTDSTSNNAGLPPEWVRTVLSLFIFVHLFAVGAGLLGRMPMASEFFRRLATQPPLLAEYRQLLDMDLPYNYALTRAEVLDIDHTLEAVIALPDGSTETVLMPDPSLAPGERARHWRRLGQNVAMYLDNPDIESVLPSYIGMGLIERYDAKDVTLILRGRYLQDRGAFSRGADPLRSELVRDLYEARVWLSDGRPRIMKKEGVGEAAPVAADPGTTTPSPTQ